MVVWVLGVVFVFVISFSLPQAVKNRLVQMIVVIIFFTKNHLHLNTLFHCYFTFSWYIKQIEKRKEDYMNEKEDNRTV
ncbi:hypothetical protein KGI01_22570 [Kurthia gibsonii]|nr:hypothetical protein KGI01_22570 [Kurthia gibsonii]